MFKQFHYILSRIMMFGVMIATGKMIATLMMNAFFASPQKWHLHAQILAPGIGQRPRHMAIPQTLAIHNFVVLLWPSDSASKQRLPTVNRKAASAALTSSSSATSACDADRQWAWTRNAIRLWSKIRCRDRQWAWTFIIRSIMMIMMINVVKAESSPCLSPSFCALNAVIWNSWGSLTALLAVLTQIRFL